TRWIMNVNVPDLPKEEIKGIRYTKLGERIYGEDFSVERQGDTIVCQLYLGYEVEQEELPLDNDVRAYQENYISITPVHRDLTKDELVDEMPAWGIQW
ncbi:MAG: 5'/3'-nucleotidase SurE, partial [Firmicutes bacterium]|nr:5'/3'-nucleotidase SurE [Bacillota bacterium]